MAKTKEQKKELLKDLEEKIRQQKSVVFIGFKGVNVHDISELRNKVKEVGGEIKVVKKTLADRAFKKNGINMNVRALEGEVALVFGLKEDILPIKLVHQKSLELEGLKILAGIFEGEIIDREKVIEIAKLPTKEELLSRLIQVISSPVSGFVNVLQGNIKGLMRVLTNVKN